MSEDLLNKLKAQGMNLEQLAAEIGRIDHASRKAVRPRDLARYHRRRAIFQREMDVRRAEQPPAPPVNVMRPERQD